MKNNNHNHYEPIEKQHYKKNYLERMLDERLAKEEIRSFTYTPTAEVPEASSVDEEGSLRAVLR